MAKVKLGTPAPTQLPKAKGVFYVRSDKRHGAIAQSWGAPGGRKTRAAGAWYIRQEFSLATWWASHASALDIMSATNMTQNTSYVYRDALIAAMYGNLFEFKGPDGQLWQRARPMTPNAQYTLDQIGMTKGQLIYRGDSGWLALNPQNDGDVLTQIAGQPSWRPYAGPATDLGEYKLIQQITVTSPTARVVFNNLSLYSDFFVTGEATTTTAASQRFIEISRDNGVTWKDVAGDYYLQGATGGLNLAGPPLLCTANNASSLWFQAQLYFAKIPQARAYIKCLAANTRYLSAQLGAFNAIGFVATSTTYTGGIFTLFGR